ncbi:MAG: hypothetical protein RLP44_20675 [Aggregatilineales bacterium]
MTDIDLFVEIFPIAPESLPVLSAYRIALAPDVPEAWGRRIGSRVVSRLKKTYPGVWRWQDGLILTDSPRSLMEITITLDLALDEQPDHFAGLEGIDDAPDYQPDARTRADFVVRETLRKLDAQITETLKKSETRLRNVRVEREHRITAQVVDGEPAVALSIISRLIYFQDVQTYAGDQRNLKDLRDTLSGLWVSDKTSPLRGEITGVKGTVAQFRDDLVVTNKAMEHFIRDAEDTDWVISVRVGSNAYDIVARALWLIVRVPELARFDVDAQAAINVLQMQPKVRAGLVAAISDVAKSAGLLQNAYNSRLKPERFFSADFELNLRFGTKATMRGAKSSVIPYKPETLADDFTRRGAYRIHEDMFDAPIRVCVVNTLALKIEDFVEALQRYVSRHLEFNIEVVRERRVRVVSQSNLESAVRVVEKEDPDIILAFFPDESGNGDDEDSDDDANATYIKSLTLGRALPTHVIYESTLDDPDSMAQIVLSILGKTGNVPYVLAEPLEKVDFVIGLALVTTFTKSTGDYRKTAISRVYSGDGAFLRYVVREIVEQNDTPPYVLIRDLFPQRDFARKRVIIHHDGPLSAMLLQTLRVWGQAIGAVFLPVEINRFGAPRLYGIDDKGICKPTWGSAVKLSASEALLVSSVPDADVTPQPVSISIVGDAHQNLPIEEALRSVLVWTLLTYTPGKLPKLPVTIMNADQLAYWLEKGNQFITPQGNVPFWL